MLVSIERGYMDFIYIIYIIIYIYNYIYILYIYNYIYILLLLILGDVMSNMHKEFNKAVSSDDHMIIM